VLLKRIPNFRVLVGEGKEGGKGGREGGGRERGGREGEREETEVKICYLGQCFGFGAGDEPPGLCTN
jgi:hypothetical protein